MKVYDPAKNTDKKPRSLLAVSNKYGRLFVGVTNGKFSSQIALILDYHINNLQWSTNSGFRVIRTEVIELLNENKSLSRITATEYEFQSVQLSSELFHLALSYDDLTLAACVVRDGCPYAEMYDIRCFAKMVISVLLFFL